MLHVAVHDYHGIACGVVESSHHCDFLSVVARQVEVAETAVGVVQLFYLLQCVVCAAVVDNEEFPVISWIHGCDLQHFNLQEAD